MEQSIQQKPQRSLFGKIVKWIFIGFNILMLIWIIGGVGGASKQVAEAGNEAAQAGAAIGTGLGAMVLIFLWVAGDLILGIFVLLTRPRR